MAVDHLGLIATGSDRYWFLLFDRCSFRRQQYTEEYADLAQQSNMQI
jgi:hypothetical protein